MNLQTIGILSKYYTIPTTIIGTQEWMTKNLDVQYYNNGDPIKYIENNTEWANATEGAWCWYNNDPNNNNYGKLYNRYAFTDPRGIAPEGFRIPKFDDISQLVTFVGLQNGGVLKDTKFWSAPNVGATNEFGLSVRGSGIRILNGGFQWLDIVSYIWFDLYSSPGFWSLGYDSSNILFDTPMPSSDKYGFGIRCLKNTSQTTTPTYSTKIMTYSTY